MYLNINNISNKKYLMGIDTKTSYSFSIINLVDKFELRACCMSGTILCPGAVMTGKIDSLHFCVKSKSSASE